MKLKPRKILFFQLILVLVAGIFYLSASFVLPGIGRFLVLDEQPHHADAVVVLKTEDQGYYPRLVEAARLYNEGKAGRIVINGNRKDAVLKRLEARGFDRGCPWYDEYSKILQFLGVPADRIMTVSVEDAYDTISEARGVMPLLIQNGMRRVIVVTSKYHTRRSGHIWKQLYGKDLDITIAAAREDEFDPDRWWHEGRQIRWVMAEYGAWIFYFKQKVTGGEGGGNDTPVIAFPL